MCLYMEQQANQTLSRPFSGFSEAQADFHCHSCRFPGVGFEFPGVTSVGSARACVHSSHEASELGFGGVGPSVPLVPR